MTKREALAAAQQATATDKLKATKAHRMSERALSHSGAEMTRFAAEIEDMLDDAGVPADEQSRLSSPIYP